jgi:AraC-like DNA-binding protein
MVSAWYTGHVSTGASESVFAIRRLITASRAHGLVLDEGPSARDPAFYARISLAHAQHLRERAVRELGPSLPLIVAGSIDEHFCLLHLAAMACRTIGDVVQLTVAHWRYMTDAFPARAVHRGGCVHLEFDVPGSAPLGVRVGVEYLLATIARASGELSGGAWRPSALVLGHRPPVALSAWEDTCGVPVHVGQVPGLVITQAALAIPVRAGMSPTATRFFRELLECHTPRPAPTLADRVAAALGRELGAVMPTVEQVAAELGLSGRTLHRQLAAEGTSYQRVLDGLRCDAAIRQAADDQRPFKAIAAAVGFADPRAFRRAFKRWTGTTPQQFRLRGLGRIAARGAE